MTFLTLELVRILYRRHVKRQSLTHQGVLPWWAERTGSTPIRTSTSRRKR